MTVDAHARWTSVQMTSIRRSRVREVKSLSLSARELGRLAGQVK